MVDLVPEGCVLLPAAFDRFRDVLWNGGAPVLELRGRILSGRLPAAVVGAQIASLDEVTNLELAEFVRPFAEGDLEALARPPTAPENVTIPRQEWATAFFPERFFLEPEISFGHGEYWDALVGRTPFVRRAQLDAWLSELKERAANARGRGVRPVHALRQSMVGLVMDGVLPSAEAEVLAVKWGQRPFANAPRLSRFDPMVESGWSLAMTVAWISMRSARAVRDSWAAYRVECWEWFPFRSRRPLDGGKEWWIAEGAELRPLDARTVQDLGLLEATKMDTEHKFVSIKSAREDLWRKLAESQIVATGLDARGTAVQIPAHEWHYLELAGKDDGTDYVIQRSVSLKAAYTDLKFLRTAVLGLWPELKNSETEGPAPFDLSAADWTLWEACQWVGCEGVARSSKEIADGDLDDKGAAVLFAAFHQQRLSVTGLTHQRIREQIPAVYWEMATTDPGQFRQRHYVSFIDDTLNDYGGEFTPVDAEKPRWFGIQVKREDLFAAFPEFAPASPDSSQAILAKQSGRRTSRKLEATRAAIEAVWPGGVPAGLSDKARLGPVNAWLRTNGHEEVSRTTIVRALLGKD